MIHSGATDASALAVVLVGPASASLECRCGDESGSTGYPSPPAFLRAEAIQGAEGDWFELQWFRAAFTLQLTRGDRDSPPSNDSSPDPRHPFRHPPSQPTKLCDSRRATLCSTYGTKGSPSTSSL